MTPPIEGLPPGVRIKSISFQHTTYQNPTGKGAAHVTLEPDNVYNVLDLAAVPIPEGYERAGATPAEWFREPTVEDIWLSAFPVDCRGVYRGCVPSGLDPRRIILRRKTKRVLVCEFENPDFPPESHPAAKDYYEAYIKTITPDHWRIEER